MAAAADRYLLFGLLALQTGIINQGQLVRSEEHTSELQSPC